MYQNILLDFPIRWLGFPQTPDWPLRVQSNTPVGVALRSLRSLVPAPPRRKWAGAARLKVNELCPGLGRQRYKPLMGDFRLRINAQHM